MTDVVILSNAKTKALYDLTKQAIRSCLATADVNIIVIEQSHVNYENCKTVIIDKPFNYNQFANLGASMGSGENIVIANNDLFFCADWLSELLKAGHEIVSPKCPNDPRQKDIVENSIGETVGNYFSGWCFLITRSLWERIGGFDEDFNFWCADNAVIEQVKAVGILPMLVPSAKVIHLGSQTLNTIRDKYDLTKAQVLKFDKKYNKDLYNQLYDKNRPNKLHHQKARIQKLFRDWIR